MDQVHLSKPVARFESPNMQFIEETATAFRHGSEIV